MRERVKIEIDTHLKIVNFFEVTFNLTNSAYRTYKRPDDFLLYVSTFSQHPPQVIKQLTTSINVRTSKNSSSEEIVNASEYEDEVTLVQRF